MKIEICKKEDRAKLVDFLRKYWKKDHILVKSPDFLEWQHGNEEGGLNFYIAKDENGEIIAVEGFIPTSKFDCKLKSNNEKWGAIWKAIPNCKIPSVGVMVSRQMEKEANFVGGLGLSKDAQTYYKMRKADFGICKQYYVLNPLINKFNIAKINLPPSNILPDSNDCDVKLIESLDDLNEITHAYHPVKSLEFIKNRYNNHPVYKYHYIECKNKGRLECLIVFRIIEVNNSKCARIVDALGNFANLSDLGHSLKKLLANSLPEIEYFDMYNHGISEDFLINSGFSVVNDNDGNIIPNYFEPFVQKNIPLHYSVLSKDKNIQYVFFKGDADQDRPNFI